MVGNGWLTRDEFWKCHPQEIWWIVNAKKEPVMYGDMTEAEVEHCLERVKAKREKGVD